MCNVQREMENVNKEIRQKHCQVRISDLKLWGSSLTGLTVTI